MRGGRQPRRNRKEDGVRKLAVGGAVLLAALFLAAVAGPGNACVGRTIQVGYFDTPEQELVANILSVFIDERTGTTVRLSRYETRDEVFDAIKRDKISLYADYSDIVLSKFGGEPPGADREKNVSRVKEVLNRKYNVIWLEQFGYDRYFSEKGRSGKVPGEGGLMLCKDSLSRFPALPKLLAKLRGTLDNETMAGLLREADASDPKTVARKFLKSRKLI